MSLTKTTSQDAVEKIIANEDTVVVVFTAPAWCAPCKQLAPHVEEAAKKTDAEFVYVDIDDAPWAQTDYGVAGVPTLYLYRYGVYAKTLISRSAVKLLREIVS